MIRTIGFRCTPKVIHYCILSYDEDVYSVTNIDKIVIPVSMEVPDKLKHIRNIILDLISEYNISVAGIRVTEPTSRTKNIFRLNMEGVILELFASSDLTCHYVGQIASISKLLDIPRTNFKPIINGDLEFLEIENFNDRSKEQKEAILTALGAFSC